jgi:hypothetical protein
MKYDPTNCFVCYWSNGYKYFESLHAYICLKPECLTKFRQLEAIDLSQYRVTPDFRGGYDTLRKSTEEDFHLRNRLLNLLLAGQITRRQVMEFYNFGIESIGKCIGGKPRKFSVSNISRDVLNIHKDFLVKPDMIRNKMDKGQIYIVNESRLPNVDLLQLFSG